MELMNKVQILFICILIKEAKTQKLNICPRKQDIRPCGCSNITGVLIVKCGSIDNRVLDNLNSKFARKEIGSFQIHHSNLGYVKNGSLRHIKAEEFVISSTWGVIDLFAAIHGMQDTLKNLTIQYVDISYWKFSPGEQFHRLKRLTMLFVLSRFSFSPIISHFPKNLKYIVFNYCNLNSLEEISFARFLNLTELNLNGNGIRSVQREMVPRPALHLISYSLGENPISSLPDDAFVDMPVLKKVMLEETRLTTLPYHIFEPIFRQLEILRITDVDLNCDCEAAWLLKRMKIWDNHTRFIKCHKPNTLTRRNLNTFMPIDLCFNCEEIYQPTTLPIENKFTKPINNIDKYTTLDPSDEAAFRERSGLMTTELLGENPYGRITLSPFDDSYVSTSESFESTSHAPSEVVNPYKLNTLNSGEDNIEISRRPFQ